MHFADSVSQNLLPTLRGLSNYAGAYIDQKANGALVVLTTGDVDGVETQVASLMPAQSRGSRVELAKHTLAELMDAIAGAGAAWSTMFPGVQLQAVALDEQGNRLVLTIAEDAPDLDISRLRSQLRVPLELSRRPPDSDTVCTTRDNCANPLRAGTWIHRSGLPPVGTLPDCTMGYHIVIGTNEHFTTAGHCGFGGDFDWFNRVLGEIGNDGLSLYGDDGQDIMYVSMNDAQRSQYIYACCLDILGYVFPIQGETLCASLGRTNNIRCGVVQSTWVKYKSDTPNPDIFVWGGDLGISAANGDSGSPIYRLNDSNQARAIGLITTEFGEFARLDTSLDNWNANVVK